MAYNKNIFYIILFSLLTFFFLVGSIIFFLNKPIWVGIILLLVAIASGYLVVKSSNSTYERNKRN